MKRFALLFAAVAAFAACSRENPAEDPAQVQPVRSEEMVFSANFDGTRTVRQANGKVFWSPNEVIAVCRTNSWYSSQYYGLSASVAASPFTSTNTTPSATADFVGLMPVDFNGALVAKDLNEYATADDQTHYWAVYPYSDDISFSHESVSLTLPASQTGVPDTFAENLYVAAAVSTDNILHFQHPLGGIKFSVVSEGITRALLTPNGELRQPLQGTVYLGYDEDSGQIYAQNYSSGYENDDTTVELIPEGGTFLPGHAYYFITLPADMETGLRLTFEKADGTSVTRVVDQAVSINRADFRTLMEADKGLSWDTSTVEVSEDAFELDPFTHIVMINAHCPVEYSVSYDCDWLLHNEWWQPGWDYEEGGDAMADTGFRHAVRVKANFGATARTGHVTFTTKDGEETVVTITQEANTLPAIHRRHMALTSRTLGSLTGGNFTNWMTSVLLTVRNELGEDNFNFAESFYGEIFPDELCVYATAYNWLGWGVIDGRVALEEWAGRNNESVDTIAEKALSYVAETDEYYIPLTALAVRSCTVDTDTRRVDVTVDVYAAKAGTYRLRGHLVDYSTYFQSGGPSMSASGYNTVMKFFTAPGGDTVVFDQDGSTKTLTFSVVAPDDFYYAESGSWGKLDTMKVIFFTEAPFTPDGRVNASAELNLHGYYIDNSRAAGYGDTQELEVTNP